MAISMASISFSQSSDAINYSEATVSESFCVTLDDEAEIQEYYAADASALNWTSEAEAKKMCGFHSNNLVSYTADYENGKVLVHIHVDRTFEKKSVAWWNDYLQSICK